MSFDKNRTGPFYKNLQDDNIEAEESVIECEDSQSSELQIEEYSEPPKNTVDATNPLPTIPLSYVATFFKTPEKSSLPSLQSCDRRISKKTGHQYLDDKNSHRSKNQQSTSRNLFSPKKPLLDLKGEWEQEQQKGTFSLPSSSAATSQALNSIVEMDSGSIQVDDSQSNDNIFNWVTGAGKEEEDQEKQEGESDSRSGNSLLKSFTSVLNNRDLAIKRFSYDLRNGKYDHVLTLDLIVRRVINVDMEEKVVKALVYDVNEKIDRWVWFYAALHLEDIREGACVKLYMPWHEMKVGKDSVITGADFFKIVSCKKWNMTKKDIQEIVNLPVPNQFRIGFSNNPLSEFLVPFHIRNNATVLKQAFLLKTSMKLCFVILHVWKYAYDDHSLCLIKDSDELLSFLVIPNEQDNFLTAVSTRPTCSFKLNHVFVSRKIVINETLPPFSVLDTFGVKQTFLYYLKWQPNTKWKANRNDQSFGISINQLQLDALNLELVDFALVQEDKRYTFLCQVKEVNKRQLLVFDLISERGLSIAFALENRHYPQQLALTCGRRIQIKFLRIFNGQAVWDKYTTFEEMHST